MTHQTSVYITFIKTWYYTMLITKNGKFFHLLYIHKSSSSGKEMYRGKIIKALRHDGTVASADSSYICAFDGNYWILDYDY